MCRNVNYFIFHVSKNSRNLKKICSNREIFIRFLAGFQGIDKIKVHVSLYMKFTKDQNTDQFERKYRPRNAFAIANILVFDPLTADSSTIPATPPRKKKNH